MRLLRFLLIEARDWLFAIAAIIGVMWTTLVLRDWWVAIPVLLGFLALYLLLLLATGRLFPDTIRNADQHQPD